MDPKAYRIATGHKRELPIEYGPPFGNEKFDDIL